MNKILNKRIAIVSGASKGIGKAIAISLANEGAKVVICARNIEELLKVKNHIQSLGGEALSLSADVTNPEDIKKVVDATVKQFGGIDILINNVGGVIKFAGFFELHDEDWRDTFNLNVMSVVGFVRCSIPWLRLSGSPRIIIISSISGVEPGSYNPHYTITKAATINLSKYLANQFASEKILVNVVCPGPVHSDSWDRNIQRIANIQNMTVEEVKHRIDDEESAKISLACIGKGNDVAGLVAFLASDQASWITGSCFHVNGGKLRSMC